MKKTLFHLVVLLSVAARAQADPVPPPNQEPDRAAAVAPSPAKPFLVAPLKEGLLGNGVRLALMELNRLPLVCVNIVLPMGGSSLDAPGKSGLASLVASLVTEGSDAMNGRQFAEALDDIGASIHVAASRDALSLVVFAAKENIDKALGLAAQAIRSPALPSADFDRIKGEMIAGLRQEQGDPGRQAEKKLNLRLYPGHPYGTAADEASVAALTLADAESFAENRLSPQGAIIAGGGDISLPEFEAMVAKHFESWRSRKGASIASGSAPPSFDQPAQGIIIDLIDMPGSLQSSIRAGQRGITRDDPDYMALAVMNFLLGRDSIVSRLGHNLREVHGWTYGARSDLETLKLAGALTIETDVQTDATAAAVNEILKELNRLRDEEVPAAELNAIKNLMAGHFMQRQQTVQALASQASTIELYGLPADELAAYRDRVMAVTPQQIQAVARKHLRPESLQIAISGDAAKVLEGLSAIGRVREFSADGRPKPAGFF